MAPLDTSGLTTGLSLQHGRYGVGLSDLGYRRCTSSLGVRGRMDISSFNGKMRDELLSREVFDIIVETKVLVERWRVEYNQIRPHSSLGYRPPAPEVKIPLSA